MHATAPHLDSRLEPPACRAPEYHVREARMVLRVVPEAADEVVVGLRLSCRPRAAGGRVEGRIVVAHREKLSADAAQLGTQYGRKGRR
jgi:hypothetical protein